MVIKEYPAFPKYPTRPDPNLEYRYSGPIPHPLDPAIVAPSCGYCHYSHWTYITENGTSWWIPRCDATKERRRYKMHHIKSCPHYPATDLELRKSGVHSKLNYLYNKYIDDMGDKGIFYLNSANDFFLKTLSDMMLNICVTWWKCSFKDRRILISSIESFLKAKPEP